MRIISGSAKGRKLLAPPQRKNNIRPTSERAREALFSILGSRVANACVLDLFAGTGAFGCEALSRDAHSVLFVENVRAALELIRKNIARIPDGSGRATIIRHDLRRGLGPIFAHGNNDRKFDIVFADPPYQTGFSEKILHDLDNSPVLSKKALVIIEEKEGVVLPEILQKLTMGATRRYGDTIFAIYHLKEKHSTSDIQDRRP